MNLHKLQFAIFLQNYTCNISPTYLKKVPVLLCKLHTEHNLDCIYNTESLNATEITG